MKMFKEKKKEYKITSATAFWFTKYTAYENLAKMYVETDNDHRAKETIVLAEKYREKFWNEVYALYPKFKNSGLSYNKNAKTISVSDKEYA